LTDGIIKGTGNSRYLKSVADFLTLYPDYTSFAQALIAGTLPIDMNGVNAAGWTQQATPLNKATLLTDQTETAIWGDASDRTIDDVLNKFLSISQAIQSSYARFAIGSYTGTGTYGADNPCSLTFDFAPDVVWIYKYGDRETAGAGGTYPTYSIMPTSRLPTTYTAGYGFGDGFGANYTRYSYGKKSEDGKTISWYTSENLSGNQNQFNENGTIYYYMAFALLNA